MSEKFNPNNYEKVSDMPEEVQGRFREVPSGGFVRSNVPEGPEAVGSVENKFIDRFTDYFKERRQEMADREVEDRMSAAHEEALLMDVEVSRKINRILEDGDQNTMEVARKYKEAEERYDKYSHDMKELIPSALLERQAKIDAEIERSRKALEESGHTGEIRTDYCPEDRCEGSIYGEIDGKKIFIEWFGDGFKGSVDGEDVSREVANSLRRKFFSIAIDNNRVRKINERVDLGEYTSVLSRSARELKDKISQARYQMGLLAEDMMEVHDTENKKIRVVEKGDSLAKSLL